MPRVVSVYLPTWPTDRWRRTHGGPPPDCPFVLVGREGRGRVVLAATAPACAAGVRIGMAASKAQALVAGLVVHDADPIADCRALDRLALWALRYSPIAAPDPPSGLVIDLTGAEHLHGGEEAVLSDVVRRLGEVGISAQAAVSDSWGASHALARFSAGLRAIAPAARAIAPLPVSALRLDADIGQALRRLGFRTIAQLASTPRAPLTLRFGQQICRRLDQAHGVLPEPIEPVRSPDIMEVRRVFAEPIGAPETLHRYTGKLVVELAAALETRGLGARRLDLLFHCVDNRVEAIRVGTSTATRDLRRLTRLLCDRIEKIEPGFGIEIMRLAATLAEPLCPKQSISALIEEPDVDVSDLIDMLSNRVGATSVYSYSAVASDVPERSVARVAAVAAQVTDHWPADWPRPSRLISPPERIDTVAVLPDHPPVVFSWRGIRRRVKRADGPERIFGEWWKGDTELVAVRDYFRVEDEAGERFWIFRAGDGQDASTGSHAWYLHGIFA
ncbi:MAG: Protein imuB [Tardiphaga sp.]|nr:Protein imuB [Tardiphaga sp.]